MNDFVRRWLAPAEGGRVRKPNASLLASPGESVVFDTYWQRRLDQGDVREVDPPAVVDTDVVASDPAPADPVTAEPSTAPADQGDTTARGNGRANK